MELHSPVAAKKLWSLLRLAFLMMRKGLISKRKLVMDMNLLMMRGKFTLGKTLEHHMFHHHPKNNKSPVTKDDVFRFSCSNNSPINPVLFPAKRRHYYFPCISAVAEADADKSEDQERSVAVLTRIESSPQCSADLSLEAKRSPISSSPFSARTSNYSLEDESGGCDREVDAKAGEFIRRFYEQLRVQSLTGLVE